MKSFFIKNREKQQFIGGDETGQAIFVFETNPLIKVGNTIRATDCYVYIRGGREKQVQNGKRSNLTIVPEIKNISNKFSLSE